MSIASMTGFARINGQSLLIDEDVQWVWELRSVNGKSLELKTRLPLGYDDLNAVLKNELSDYANRGNFSASLDILRSQNGKKAVIDEAFLTDITKKAIDLSKQYEGMISLPNSAELLGLRGVVEIEENHFSEEQQNDLKQKILADFRLLCQNLRADRMVEGAKIAKALEVILDKIEQKVFVIENKAQDLPDKLKQKLKSQLAMYADDVTISEDRMAQEILLLVNKADIREEIDRLKAHIKAAREMLGKDDAVGRRLDFLCQELNREANTTCSKSADIEITNLAMDLKVLIEQFREQIQNIE